MVSWDDHDTFERNLEALDSLDRREPDEGCADEPEVTFTASGLTLPRLLEAEGVA